MSIYPAKKLDAVLRRITGKLESCTIKMLPVAQENDIADLENDYDITLPIAYRRFISEVAEGCIFKDADDNKYTLNSIFSADIDKDGLNKPFPLENYWIWEDDFDYDSTANDYNYKESKYGDLYESMKDGHFPLLEADDYRYFHLIVKGKCAGEIWDFAEMGAQSLLFPRRDFLSWFEFLLDNGDHFYESPKFYRKGFRELNRS